MSAPLAPVATGESLTEKEARLRRQLEEVQRDVAQLLEHGLTPPVTPGEAAAPAELPAEETETAAVPQ